MSITTNIKNKINNILVYVFAIVLIIINTVNAYDNTDISNSSFEMPLPGQIISSPLCTLSVITPQNVKSVAFRATYRTNKNVSDTINIGILTRPPYKLVWDVSKLPNQLYDGMIISSKITSLNQWEYAVISRNIFLTNNPVKCDSINIKYSPTGKSTFSLKSNIKNTSGNVQISHDDNNIYFDIDVKNQFFYSDNAIKNNKSIIEIMLDPKNEGKPYPSNSTIMYTLPISKNAHKVFWKNSINKFGMFELTHLTEKTSLPISVNTQDFSGYHATVSIPRQVFKDTIRLNITALVWDENNNPHKISLIHNNTNSTYLYCPYLWNFAVLQPKPFYANPVIIFIAGFIGGVALVFAYMILLRLIKTTSDTLSKFEGHENDDKLWESIQEIVNSMVTDKELNQQKIATQLGIPTQRVNKLVKKYANENLNNYVIRKRIEIVKERLRSSHSSHTAISESVGFQSVEDMEKYFKKIYRTTPNKFREDYQVS